MSEAANIVDPGKRVRKIQYRGRGGQVFIYLGKLLRGMIYQSDWKVLPMAALIAGIVSMVVRRDYFLTMEGTLKGALALTCLSIWNGCFNSIQVVCREREVIKREHRSGLHISAYIFSHMVYQAILCLLQTAITLYVCRITGVQFPKEGLFTPWLVVDLGITIFLITYASDMLSLWISCITHSTTTAMTVMPFVLIFQLVFSGGIFTLPEWAERFAPLSISNYGMKSIAAQSDYNGRPLVTAWNTLERISDHEIPINVTLGQVVDFLSDDSRALVHDIREKTITLPTEQELMELFTSTNIAADGFPDLQELLELMKSDPQPAEAGTVEERQSVALGDLIDELAANSYIQDQRDLSYSTTITLDQLVDTFGREKLQTYVQQETAAASHIAAYENTRTNIRNYWLRIGSFVAIFAFLSVAFLEFVDKDKR